MRYGPILLGAVLTLALCGCAAEDADPPERFKAEMRDLPMETVIEPQGAARVYAEMQARQAEQEEGEAEDAPQAQQDAAWDEVWVEPEYEPAWEDYGDYSGSVYSSDFDFMRDGVVHGDDGTTYKWYPSSVLYHYRTPEWNLDDEGFYRTDEGYYVVASSDYPEGTIVDTPWGEGMVLDSGCDSGTVDMYVGW